jgi:hypothetical protein
MSDSTNLSVSSSGNSNAINTLKQTMQGRNLALEQLKYGKRITRDEPAAIVLLLDQSGSMSLQIKDNKGIYKSKAEHLAWVVNQFMEELLLTCQKEVLKEYFEILIIGYGRNIDGEVVQVVWKGPLKGKDWVTVPELRNGSLRTESISYDNPKPIGKRIITEEAKIWVEPVAEGLTPMRTALELAIHYLENWTNKHSDSFPPMVFNITDGYATDISSPSELVDIANKLKAISTDDGDTLLFNLLLMEELGDMEEYPLLNQRDHFSDSDYYLSLFDASSTIPNNLLGHIRKKNYKPQDGEIKGLVFGDINSIINMLNIGTSTISNSSS